MKRLNCCSLIMLVSTGCNERTFHPSESADTADTGAARVEKCDVVVVGGSTAATGAAIAAAKELQNQRLSGRRVCLLEPTDWAGGQLTAGGVPAIDFDHHSKSMYGAQVNLSTMAANNTKAFVQLVSAVGGPVDGLFRMEENPGLCTVSNRCYEPKVMLNAIRSAFAPLERAGVLKVFYNTVPKSAVREGKNIKSVLAVERTPLNAEERQGMYNRRFSSVVEDWYSPADSSNYKKQVVNFVGTGGYPVFIDASEWGELMVLAKADWQQGVDGNETCGQAFIFPLALQIHGAAKAPPEWYTNNILPSVTQESKGIYSLSGAGGTWEKLWRYRRMKVASRGNVWNTPPGAGDISQINVNQGNDYPTEYLFPSRAEVNAQIADWKGGVRVSVLAHAEIHSLGFFQYLRSNDGGSGFGAKLGLSDAFGTANGLARVPYIRDTRRTVGIGGFRINYDDIYAGNRYADSVAIGLYAADEHPVKGCSLPNPPHEKLFPKPFYLPLRAHTNAAVDNMLVAGKLIAQDFLTSAATRLHPIEFASGTAAGVAAVFMNQFNVSSGTLLGGGVQDVITRVKAHGPVEWTR